ncbi:hypothetical protein BCV70DRAFT_196688 [Testicularia cyperi]|uniref:DNA mismatch repair protein MSH3 n=1 Tax=Testicularia cyperi TaxID=1882483 RepID=A0A317XVW6_9BASI|nr:hypothetical protein BCV70DRAFT_196688 [Testicularia cyperi]
MPPSSSSKPATGQATISSFFKAKPAANKRQEIFTEPSRIASSSTSPQGPPTKRPKLSPDEQPRKETVDRLSKWQFTAPADGATSEPLVLDGDRELALPTSSQRSAEQQRRHERFKNKLLGSEFFLDRQARQRAEFGDDAEAGPSSRAAGSADSPLNVDDDDDTVDKTEVLKNDDDEDGDSETVQPISNRFSRYAAPRSEGTRNDSKGLIASKKGKGKATDSPDNGITYTPLEKQILELRAAHPGVLLIIEVGYKLKFYGEDARIAAKELNIMCFPERNLYTAMIPVHRLHIHIKKLIAAGHKVGVVRQIETRALKAASKNAYTPFVRKLTALYTSSTWVDDLGTGDDMASEYTSQPKSLMAIVEQSEGGNGPEDRVSIGVISVEVTTGNVTFDQFSDGYARSELETRLAHLSPAEVLISKRLTKPTEKVISHLLGGGAEGGVRIERLEAKPDYHQAFEAVTKFYRDMESSTGANTEAGNKDQVTTDTTANGANKEITSNLDAGEGPSPSHNEQKSSTAAAALPLVMSLPHLCLIALAQIIQHLRAFQLESICSLSANFQSFASRTTMLLNSNTLANLEIFRSAESYQERGSLVWLLDKCRTKMGRRTLRKWVSRPLTDVVALERRLDAVEALVAGKSYVLRSLPNLLQGLPDLERGLARMTYGRITPSELATVLLSLNRVTQEFRPAELPTMQLGSDLLEEHIVSLSASKDPVQRYLGQISIKEARANNKADLFVDADRYPAVQAAKDNIAVVESELRDHLRSLRKDLKRPSLEYVSVAGVDFLIEMRVADAKKVPADWLRVSATKQMVRFHTPEVLRLSKLRDQHRETLDAEANAAFTDFVTEMCRSEYLALRNVVTSLAIIDVLISLSELAQGAGYTRPSFDQQPNPGDATDGARIEIRGMRHPILEVINQAPYIPNDLVLADETDCSKAVLLTGCNMGGKSSVSRCLGLIVIMAQIGSFVPATYARLGVHDGVFVRMGARDSMFSGKSTFMVEVQETAEILRSVTPRSLVILDELGRGTSTFDGLCIAQGVLEYLLQMSTMPNTVFISHYFQLGDLEARYGGRIRNFHMAFTEGKNGEDIQFLYKLKQGIASKSFGIHCARLAGLPRDILASAQQISETLEEQHANTKRRKLQRDVVRLFSDRARDDDQALRRFLQLVPSIRP